MQFPKLKLYLAAAVAVVIGSPAVATPLVASLTTANIGGSGYDAIDFYYESTPGAEFTNYYLDFGTSNGALIYDPLPGDKQDAGGDAIDTFMNTIGSLQGVGDAVHLYGTYTPGGDSAAPASIDRIEWDVFDMLAGDTNDFQGNVGSYHMARVLVQPNAMWHATFKAYDTATAGIGATRNFTNDPSWTFPQPVAPPLPPAVDPVPQPPVLPDPPVPTPVDPGPVAPPIVPPLPTPKPVVSTSTVLNVGGSGYNAIDFYYSNSPGAEFTNYNLNFRTADGAGIYDPLASQRQDAGSDAVDTFMNTVGSLLELENATHLYSAHDPTTANGSDLVSKIEWDVFDLLPGDTNNMNGAGEAPYHLARILVNPDSTWNATFTAFDTNNPGIPTAHNFTNDPDGFTPEFVPVPVVPDPVTPDPVVPDPGGPVHPDLPPQPDPPPQPDLPPTIDEPPSDDDSVVTMPVIQVPLILRPGIVFIGDPVAIDIPYYYFRNEFQYPPNGLEYRAREILAAADLTDISSAPLFADDRFLVPGADGTFLYAVDLSQRATISSFTTAGMITFNSQVFNLGDIGVPEPTSALLASFAVASLTAARRRRR